MNEFLEQLLETIEDARIQLEEARIDGIVGDVTELTELLAEVIDEIKIHYTEEEEWQ